MSFMTILEKRLLYDNYTLDDEYKYKDIDRKFQWEKIKSRLNYLDSFMNKYSQFGILYNYKNSNGLAEKTANGSYDEFGAIVDSLGTPRRHAIPLLSHHSIPQPALYGRDGSLIAITSNQHTLYVIKHPDISGEWLTLKKYVHPINTTRINKVIIVDRTNQNIATLERSEDRWLIRSMNPATTGINTPPYRRATPLGIYIIHHRIPKMFFLYDGTSRIGGYAPYASRFSGGGYIHGVPVNLPQKEDIEYSETLGTEPRSHMCVRSATSHARYIYNWCDDNETAVIIIE